ncbi:MAG: metallophosphoesterase family protein [Promethearchaeota archaeon]
MQLSNTQKEGCKVQGIDPMAPKKKSVEKMTENKEQEQKSEQKQEQKQEENNELIQNTDSQMEQDNNKNANSEEKPPQDIVIKIFDQLLHPSKENPVSYSDYLSFFSELNSRLEDPFPAILETSGSNAYYIGDTHGSYQETLMIIPHLQARLEFDPDLTVIFEGDYVDRNPKDLENFALISAFYARYPHRVVLLRGNHEDLLINLNYGFLSHLSERFIFEDMVKELYKEILTIFMKLPIANVLTIQSPEKIQNDKLSESHSDFLSDSQSDSQSETKKESEKKKIFAVHGGIPVNPKNPKEPILLAELKEKICPNVSDFQKFDEFTSWMLWADPSEDIDGIKLNPDSGRHQFGETIFKKFIQGNDISLMMRAHEVLEDGFRYMFHDKLVSLFSSSYYNDVKIGQAVIAYVDSDLKISIVPIIAKDLASHFEIF